MLMFKFAQAITYSSHFCLFLVIKITCFNLELRRMSHTRYCIVALVETFKKKPFLIFASLNHLCKNCCFILLFIDWRIVIHYIFIKVQLPIASSVEHTIIFYVKYMGVCSSLNVTDNLFDNFFRCWPCLHAHDF